MQGFSLLEMMVVLALALIISGIALMSFQPTLRNSRVNNGYNIALMAMRQARDVSIAQRQTYFVTFNANASPPDTITLTQGGTGTVITTYSLPTDVRFLVQAGIPTSGPDGFGAGNLAIDFDQGVGGGAKNVVYFMPDGSAQDVNGNLNSGVVYLCRAGDLYSSRAITVWSATGRLRGWRLYNNSGTKYWRQM